MTPTAEEWHDFAEFYERARSAHESDGVVLVKLPSPVIDSPTGEIKAEITDIHQQILDWSKAGTWARVQYEKKTYRPLVVWTIPARATD